MSRALSPSNLFAIKHKTIDIKGGVWADVLGKPEDGGAWLIFGNDKNGKTTTAIALSKYLSQWKRVLYVSGEEGFSLSFVDTCRKVGVLSSDRKLRFLEYASIEEIELKLRNSETGRRKQNAPQVIVIDNITVYVDELKHGKVRKLLQDNPNVLFIFLAHEDGGQPYTSTAKMVKKLAKVIIRVQGLACFVSGRCPGGRLDIDPIKSQLFHGYNNKEK